MTLATMIIISVLVGLVAGGFSWFGWELVQNLRAMLRGRAARKTMPPESAHEPTSASVQTSSGRSPSGHRE